MNALIKSSKKRYWEILTLMGRPAVRRWAPLVIALVGVGVARGPLWMVPFVGASL